MRFPSPIAGVVAALLVSVTPGAAQERVEVFPLDPHADAVIGPRTPFTLGYRGIDDRDLRDARFRIELRALDSAGRSIVFDQRDRKRGWMPGEPGVMLYRPRKPLRDGTYEWGVAVWDGLAWQDDDRRLRFRVDSVPPAEVEHLRVAFDPETSALRLEWDPVSLDRDGGPEYVARYRVYRYSRADRTPRAKPFEVLETELPMAQIPASGPEEARLWFFRVTAEDLAGNEAERPR